MDTRAEFGSAPIPRQCAPRIMSMINDEGTPIHPLLIKYAVLIIIVTWIATLGLLQTNFGDPAVTVPFSISIVLFITFFWPIWFMALERPSKFPMFVGWRGWVLAEIFVPVVATLLTTV